MADEAGKSSEVGLNFAWLVLDTTRRMRDAQAAGRIDEYYTHFEYGLQLLLSHMEIEIRSLIEEDFKTLELAIAVLKKDTSNTTSKATQIQELKKDFADSHRYFIFDTLPRASIIKINRDGAIDFKKHDFEQLQAIVRTTGGLPSTLKNAVGEPKQG